MGWADRDADISQRDLEIFTTPRVTRRTAAAIQARLSGEAQHQAMLEGLQ